LTTKNIKLDERGIKVGKSKFLDIIDESKIGKKHIGR
jgi:hypothetical protein